MPVPLLLPNGPNGRGKKAILTFFYNKKVFNNIYLNVIKKKKFFNLVYINKKKFFFFAYPILFKPLLYVPKGLLQKYLNHEFIIIIIFNWYFRIYFK